MATIKDGESFAEVAWGANCLLLENLWVAPKDRGSGVAVRLLARVYSEARNAGFKLVRCHPAAYEYGPDGKQWPFRSRAPENVRLARWYGQQGFTYDGDPDQIGFDWMRPV